MQFAVNDKVEHMGRAYRITKLENDTAKIVIVRSSRGYPGFTVVPVATLKPYAAPSKVSAHAKTCQICGRPIHAAAGKIAHHGYLRPGDGQQTESCFGARYVPFEVSRDRLGEYLELLPRLIEQDNSTIKMLEGGAVPLFRFERKCDEHGRVMYRSGVPEMEPVQYSRGAPEYPALQATEITKRRNRIADYTLQIEEQTKRFNTWSPKP